MRYSALVGIVLTLLMLLLVTVAAFIFLFQGRQTLLSENRKMQDDLASAAAENGALSQSRDELATAVAMAESDAILLEGQLVESEQARNSLQAEVESTSRLLAELEQDRLDMLARPPQVTIVAPEESEMLQAGSPVELVMVAADPVGITEMTLKFDEQVYRNYVANGQSLLTATESWTPLEAGTVLMSVEAGNGRTSTIVTRTLSISSPSSALSTVATDPNSALRADIGSKVSELRGLRPLQSENSVVLTRAEVEERINARNLWDTAVLPVVLTSFDFTTDSDPPSATNVPILEQLPATSFYDVVTNEMLVAGGGETWSPPAQLAYVQQYTHLLQDQHYSLDNLYTDSLSQDARLALAAYADGEVGFVKNAFLRSGFFSEDALNAVFAAIAEGPSSEILPVFAAETQFRQEQGLEFVQALFDEDGVEAIAAGWQNVPQSTEQILHPEKYAADERPTPVTLPSLAAVLGENWSMLVEDTFGELWLRSYLGQQLNAAQVETAASGWGGDRYTIYGREDGAAVAMVLWITWDSEQDSVEFAALYPNYPTGLFNTAGQLQPDGGECWQGDDVICLYQRDIVTFIVRAPDLETAVLIAGAVDNG